MADSVENAEVEQLSWYHYNITRHAAEGLLMANGKDGSYLLRASASSPGEYSLSVRCASSVKHFQIGWDGSQFKFGMGSFSNINEFVEHFENKPLIGGDSGVLTLLKYPYPRDVEEPTTYEKVPSTRRVGQKTERAALENNTDDGVHSFASKEGYLTKLGGKVKNWKTRWFVLLKNELKYFKTKGDKEPIKTIDLENCQEVARDDSNGKGNCFRVVMPYRTFFCYANSTQEAEEWIKILQWKLENVNTLSKHRRSTVR
ncbi:Dual adapter for phosphotyrosine and 3-phosphotyrosine and 3-phosphoinositide [Desmophyllum pertusum]|uniref:Dual adapter for phosphotyrosine and 3-phosphotyrosine and 3-phosphoinositide n=1 Tax=Desmophyllum pertusum TaxID=174260 RepID=A0A9W9ZIB4_9CNID|nr:Dual adapter for phosphotyrosine and 3-phosphotyrosine and 3-phosphoinositide [Desmophyllum pertusum]